LRPVVHNLIVMVEWWSCRWFVCDRSHKCLDGIFIPIPHIAVHADERHLGLASAELTELRMVGWAVLTAGYDGGSVDVGGKNARGQLRRKRWGSCFLSQSMGMWQERHLLLPWLCIQYLSPAVHVCAEPIFIFLI